MQEWSGHTDQPGEVLSECHCRILLYYLAFLVFATDRWRREALKAVAVQDMQV